MSASFTKSIQSFIGNIKKITNAFKVLYSDYKLIKSWKIKHHLTWTEMKSYELPPFMFQQSKFASAFTRHEIEKIKLTMKSLPKIGGFFVVQLVPIIGYVPIAIALLYPRHILTSHFWDNEQKERFMVEACQERLAASKRLYYQLLECEDNAMTDASFTTIITQRKALFGSNLSKYTPFPFRLNSSLQKKFYLVMLLQSQGIFSAAPASFLFLFPQSYLNKKLQAHLHEIINDDFILHKNHTTLSRLAGEEEGGGLEEVKRVKMLRGFHPTQDNSHTDFLHYWQQSETIRDLKTRLQTPPSSDVKTNAESSSSFPLEFLKEESKGSSSSKISDEELLLFRIVWNTILSTSPMRFIPSSTTSR